MIASLLFAASAVAYIMDLYGADARLWGWSLAAAGALAETLTVVTGRVAPPEPAFAIAALTWLVVANFLIADGFLGLRAAGALLMPVATLASAVVWWLPASAVARPAGLLESAHLFFALAGYGAFVLAFAASGLYLIQERALRRRAFEGPYRRVPPLVWLDRAAHGLVLYGFPMLCVALATEVEHGPRAAVLGTGAVCALAGAYVLARARGRLKGRPAARAAVWGFAGVLVNLLLLSLLVNSV